MQQSLHLSVIRGSKEMRHKRPSSLPRTHQAFTEWCFCYYHGSAKPAAPSQTPVQGKGAASEACGRVRGIRSPAPCLTSASEHRRRPALWSRSGRRAEGGGCDGWLSAVLRCVKRLMEVSGVSRRFPHCGARVWGPSSPILLMFPDVLGAWKALRCFAEKEENTK